MEGGAFLRNGVVMTNPLRTPSALLKHRIRAAKWALELLESRVVVSRRQGVGYNSISENHNRSFTQRNITGPADIL